MNKQTRNRIEKIAEELKVYLGKIDDLKNEIESFRDDETERFASLSEKAQNGDKGEEMQMIIDTLDNSLSSFESVDSELEDTVGHLMEIVETV